VIPGKKYQLEDLIAIAWRRKWLILVPFALVGSLTAVVSRSLPDLFRSETLILVVPQRVLETYVRSTVTSRIEDRLPSLRQQILSRSRLERIIVDLILYQPERQSGTMEAVVERMRQAISIEIVKGDSFTVSYISRDPQSAKDVTERLASLFIEENVRDREFLAVSTSQFLETQLDDARRRLIEQERKLEAYRVRNANELPSQIATNVQAVQSARMQLQALSEAISRDRDRRLTLEARISDLSEPLAASTPAPPASGPGTSDDLTAPSGATASEQLESARTALRKLSLRLKPDHPDILRLNRIIRDLEQKEAAGGDGAANARSTVRAARPTDASRELRLREIRSEIETLDRELALKQDREKQLREEIALYQGRLEAAPIREAELTELTRDYDTLQQIYRNLLTKREDSKIAANLEHRQVGEQFRVLDAARVPERPFSPNRTRINLLGLFAGLTFGAGLAAFLEYRDSTVKTDEEVRTLLLLPVLATIPILTSGEFSWRGRTNVMVSFAAATAAAVGVLVWKLVW